MHMYMCMSMCMQMSAHMHMNMCMRMDRRHGNLATIKGDRLIINANVSKKVVVRILVREFLYCIMLGNILWCIMCYLIYVDDSSSTCMSVRK